MSVSGIYHLGIEVIWFEAIELERIDLLFDYRDIHRTASFILQRTEGVKSVPAVTDEAYSMQTESPLMTLEQTAEFLNLTESQVKRIISSENALRAQGDSEGVPFPYIVVQNEIYVSQIGLISWLEGATRERRIY